MTYKAGDFTSGKMNEIFKQAYNSCSVIRHKQFGDFYMLPESFVADIATHIFVSNHEDYYLTLQTGKAFDLLNEDVRKETIEGFYVEAFDNWWEILERVYYESPHVP